MQLASAAGVSANVEESMSYRPIPFIAATVLAFMSASTAFAQFAGPGAPPVPSPDTYWGNSADPNLAKPPAPPPAAFSTNPDGARYYPGIGFRYVLPPQEQPYGRYAGPRVYGYYAQRAYGYRNTARERAACRNEPFRWYGGHCRDQGW
jgi:hypothetical protein